MTTRSAPRRVGKRVANRLRSQPRLALALAILVTVILYAVPRGQSLAYPLMLLSTLAHEMGHGVAAILVGGRFHRFEMWPDGSGVAFWSARGTGPGTAEIGRLELAFVAAGGLVGPAIVAALLLVAARRPRGARQGLLVLAGALGLALLLVVRGFFGMFFVAVLAVGLFAVARASGDELARLVLVFLAVQLALSVFSRGDYLFTPTAQTGAGPMPSDVGQMAAALFLPYWFWGALCGLVSVVVVAASLRLYWRSDD